LLNEEAFLRNWLQLWLMAWLLILPVVILAAPFHSQDVDIVDPTGCDVGIHEARGSANPANSGDMLVNTGGRSLGIVCKVAACRVTRCAPALVRLRADVSVGEERANQRRRCVSPAIEYQTGTAWSRVRPRRSVGRSASSQHAAG
jgi:hypothetical protein